MHGTDLLELCLGLQRRHCGASHLDPQLFHRYHFLHSRCLQYTVQNYFELCLGLQRRHYGLPISTLNSVFFVIIHLLLSPLVLLTASTLVEDLLKGRRKGPRPVIVQDMIA
jgi:hypothetical protein